MHLYILIYIYANVLNYILFQSILTNILACFMYKKTNIIYTIHILYMHVLLYLLCTHYPIIYVLLLLLSL